MAKPDDSFQVEWTSEEIKKVIGFGNWTAAWTCDADAGSLSAVFGVDYGCSDDIVLYYPMEGGAAKPAPALAIADLHITIAGGHCGKADCTRCDPMERYVDGLTVRQCLARFTVQQRNDHGAERLPLTPAQKDAARTAWSAQLKAKVQQAEEKGRVAVVVDDDRWEP